MKYYLYQHTRIDNNEIFYVGVGTMQLVNNKYKYHSRAKDKVGRNPIWKKIATKTTHTVEIIFETDDYSLALSKEIEYIELYGRIDLGTGILANMTKGGEGVIGLSEEIKSKRRIAMTGLKRSKESRKKMSLAKTGGNNPMFKRKHSEETKLKISQGIKLNPPKPHKLSLETIEKLRNGRIGAKHWGSQKIINTETKEIYDTLTAAAASIGINRGVFK